VNEKGERRRITPPVAALLLEAAAWEAGFGGKKALTGEACATLGCTASVGGFAGDVKSETAAVDKR
jgi:hypothetical protein